MQGFWIGARIFVGFLPVETQNFASLNDLFFVVFETQNFASLHDVWFVLYETQDFASLQWGR